MPVKKPPTFSVIIPCLNEERHLPLILSDLSRQTFKDFNVIVVDAHSTDRTVTKASSFSRKLNLSIINSPKRHVSHQRNLGAKNNPSPWYIFMDADNRIPHYFLQGVKFRIEETKPQILTLFCTSDSQNPKDQLLCTISNLYIDLQKNTSKPGALEAMMVFSQKTFHRLKGFSDKVSWGEGGELMKRASKLNIQLTVCKTPTWTYSTRRLKKEGTIKLARSVAIHELHRILDIPLEQSRAQALYPMKGGTYFHEKDKRGLLGILASISNPKQFSQEIKQLISDHTTRYPAFEPIQKFIDSQTKTQKPVKQKKSTHPSKPH